MKIEVEGEERVEGVDEKEINKREEKNDKEISKLVKNKLLFDQRNIGPFKLIFHISSYPEIILMLVGCIGYIGAGLSDPLMALLLGDTINKFIENNKNISEQKNQNQHNLAIKEFSNTSRKIVIRFLYIGIISFFSNFLGGVILGFTSLRQIHKLKKNYFKLLLSQEQKWFDENNSFELSTKVQMQVEQIELGLGDKYGLVALNFAKIVGGLTISFISSWKLTLVIISLFPLNILLIIYILCFLRDLPILVRKSYEKAGGIAEEILYNIKIIFSFVNYDYELNRFNIEIKKSYLYENENAVKTAVCLGLLSFFSLVSDMLTILYGKKLIVDKTWNPIRKEKIKAGNIVTILFSISAVMTSIRLITPSYRLIQNSALASSDYFNLLERKINKNLLESDLKSDSIVGKIEFKNINFSYQNDKIIKQVLNNMNFIIEPGKTVALVGESGCGKTTIVNLIERLYEPNSGEILLDDINIKSYNLKTLRNLIGYIQQEPILFNQSIKENIIFGREEQINKIGNINKLLKEACKEAYAEEFIEKIKEKYDYIVGIKGNKLSGGQKQRIAIARAIICKPKILILDEATSSLDNMSEKEVQIALDNITKKNVTTIIIAHKLSTIKKADLIYLIKDGRIYDKGNHYDLYNKNGIYTELIKAKLKKEEFKKRQNELKYILSSNEKINDENEFDNNYLNKESIDDSGKKYKINLINVLKLINKKNDKFWIFIGSLCSLIHGATYPVLGFIFAKSINIMSGDDSNKINKDGKFWGLMILVLAFAQGLSYLIKLWKLNSLGSLIVYEIRKKILKKYLEMHLSFFEKEENIPGKLLSKLTIDTIYLNSIILIFFGDLTGTLGAFIIGAIWGLTIDWKLTLVSICFLPFIIGAKIYIHKARRGGRQANRKIMIEAGSVLSEFVTNTKTIFAFNYEKEAIKIYSDILQKEKKTFLRDAFLQGFIVGLGVMASYFCNATIFHLSSEFIKKSLFTFNEMTLSVYLIIYTAEGISSSLLGIGDYEKISNGYDSIFKTINTKSEINSFENVNKDKIGCNNIRGEIEFKNVSFAYPTKSYHKILKNVSFKISPGQSVALVGYSGCGKSTIIQLIERFYDINEGEILIDGINIKNYNLYELRKNIGFVDQEPTIFKRTPFENIKYGNLESNNNQILNAAKKAKIEYLCRQKEIEGVSGGEKQRLAIARVFLKDPKILLFDEATSALDKETEIRIQESIDQFRHIKTCVLVAHRLNTIINSDMILVFEDGKIVESGTHQKLLELGKKYATLYKYSEQ